MAQQDLCSPRPVSSAACHYVECFISSQAARSSASPLPQPGRPKTPMVKRDNVTTPTSPATVACVVFTWCSCEFLRGLVFYRWLFLALHFLQVPRQSSSQLSSTGSSCTARHVISVGPPSCITMSLSWRYFFIALIWVKGEPNHSVNIFPHWPVSPSCELDNPSGHTLLSVVCHSGCSVYSKQTVVSAVSKINAWLAEQQMRFSWETCMLLLNKAHEFALSTWELEMAV